MLDDTPPVPGTRANLTSTSISKPKMSAGHLPSSPSCVCIASRPTITLVLDLEQTKRDAPILPLPMSLHVSCCTLAGEFPISPTPLRTPLRQHPPPAVSPSAGAARKFLVFHLVRPVHGIDWPRPSRNASVDSHIHACLVSAAALLPLCCCPLLGLGRELGEENSSQGRYIATETN